MRSIKLTLVVATFAFAGAAALAQGVPVTAQEIQAGWTGKSLFGTTPSGAPVRMTFRADGTVTLSAGSLNDSGTWRVSDTGYCTTWKTIRAGQERCFTAHKADGKITVLNPDGSVSGYFNDTK